MHARMEKRDEGAPVVREGWLVARMVTSSDFPRINMPRHPDEATGGEDTISTKGSASSAEIAADDGLSICSPLVPASAASAPTRASELSDSLDGDEAEGDDDDGPLRSAVLEPRICQPLCLLLALQPKQPAT